MSVPMCQYMLNFGGGLLGGDVIGINCVVGEGCTVALATQGSTKVSTYIALVRVSIAHITSMNRGSSDRPHAVSLITGGC